MKTEYTRKLYRAKIDRTNKETALEGIKNYVDYQTKNGNIIIASITASEKRKNSGISIGS
jgi:hypothetical protein